MASLQLKRYRQLIEQLGKELGERRGWKTQVAQRLGVHPSFVSKVLSGETKEIGGEVIDKAMAALDLDGGYFFDDTASAVEDHTYYTRAAIKQRGDTRREQVRGRPLVGRLESPDPKNLDPEQTRNALQWMELSNSVVKVLSSVNFKEKPHSELVEMVVDRRYASELARGILRLDFVANSLYLLTHGDELPDGKHAARTLEILRSIQELIAVVATAYFGDWPKEPASDAEIQQMYQELGIERRPWPERLVRDDKKEEP